MNEEKEGVKVVIYINLNKMRMSWIEFKKKERLFLAGVH